MEVAPNHLKFCTWQKLICKQFKILKAEKIMLFKNPTLVIMHRFFVENILRFVYSETPEV